MKNYKYLPLIFTLSLSVNTFSQQNVKLDWEEVFNHENSIFSFKNSTFLHEFNGLASYQQLNRVKSNNTYEISISDERFKAVSSSEKRLLESLEITEKVLFRSEILISKGEFYNRIMVFPYVKQNNQYKKLTSFSFTNKKKSAIKSRKKNRIKTNSVLSTNNCYKISVSENGVYKLTFSDLQSLGVNTNSLNVNSIALYGNGGGMLPRLNSAFRYEDLQENAIEIVDNNNNGIFENGDLVLFYGQSVDEWEPYDNYIGKYHFHKHLYDDFNYYFLTIKNSGTPKRINPYIPTFKGVPIFNDKFNDMKAHEVDLVNFIQSGESWYGEEFDADISQTFSFNFPNLVDNSTVHIKANIAARAFSSPNFSLNYEGNQFMDIDLGAVVSGYVSDYATTSSVSGEINAQSDNLDINVNFNRNSSSHKGWLNFIEVCGFRNLIMSGSQMNFRKTISAGANQIYGLSIDNFSVTKRVWNVTTTTDIKEHELLYVSDNKYTFGYDMSMGLSDEKFIAFDGTEYKTPNLIGHVPNQNLHGETDFEMLIVSHPNFLSAANKLSNHHFQKDGRKCKVVTPQQVYNEFSSGKQDISSIRDYCKYLYDLSDSTFKFLLIIGDASYDPKDRIPNNTNFVITYQSANSVSPLNTFATDDYFGYLDENEGLLQGDLIDIGIGRLPAKTSSEANNMVDKIINYSSRESMGEWRNISSFIADDGDDSDGNIHMIQAESLANIVDDNYNNFNFDKFYVDAYNQESTPIGQRSPDCRNAITRRVEKGSLLVNYTGHGGEKGLTSERIIEVDQILDWKNYNQLALFVTATCEFGRFDNPELTSGGEYIILNPEGGGVALLTTTRYVYSHLNYTLNTHFINSLFEKENGEIPTLGDVFRKTKILSGTSINSNKFTLLGDPMMRLAFPKYNVKTTVFPDTLNVLGKVSFHGEITTSDSVKLSDFNGIIYTTVFDKEILAKTQGQQSSTPMPYRKQKNILYKGTSTVKNGEFSFEFVVPKDIDYNFDNGRISYYAVSETENIDASGWEENFIVGGISSDFEDDDIGPEIELYMNDKQFVSGGLTNNEPIFLAFVKDSSGINTVGSSIGHDITLTLDGDNTQKIVLNEYYQADKDSYQSGKVEYSLSNLSSGLHTLNFKVWDVFNNSSEQSIEFFVSETEDFVINHLLNYPNPFTTHTDFYFEHNRPNQPLEVQIQVFTVSGKLVKTINTLENDNGFRVGPIAWNGKDDFQDNIGRGTYIYKVKIKDENGEFVEKFEKLVILK